MIGVDMLINPQQAVDELNRSAWRAALDDRERQKFLRDNEEARFARLLSTPTVSAFDKLFR